ncbi:hypothetical protein SNEBB_004659 [Seison nebaliae]|nr:hypothetical protein SNEBB_004659 [Seison nebaliae]
MKESLSKEELKDLINDLEISDSQMNTVIRQALIHNNQKLLLTMILERIRTLGDDLENMSNHHYQKFIDSFHELMNIRDNIKNFKESISNNNVTLMSSLESIIKQLEYEIDIKDRMNNIHKTRQALKTALPIVEQFKKLQREMEKKRYYQALNVIEKLEKELLPNSQHLSFVDSMRINIDHHRQQILDESRFELNQFLEIARASSKKVGYASLIFICNKYSLSFDPTNLPPFIIMNIDNNNNNNNNNNNLQSIQKIVDFSPLYRSLHINKLLNKSDEFQEYYQRQRIRQSGLTFVQKKTENEFLMDNFRDYFLELLGFCVIEDHILNTTTGLIDQPYYNNLANEAVKQLSKRLSRIAMYKGDKETLGSIRTNTVIYTSCLREFGLNPSQFQEISENIRTNYLEVLKQTYRDYFQEIFQEDTCNPMKIEIKEMLETKVMKFLISAKLIVQSEEFPVVLSFTQMVPETVKKILEFIQIVYNFMKDNESSMSEIDEKVHYETDLLIKNHLNDKIREYTETTTMTLQGLILMSINLNTLDATMPFIDQSINDLTGIYDYVHSTQLSHIDQFKDLKFNVDTTLTTKLGENLNEILDNFSQFEWMTDECQGKASRSTADAIELLSSIFSGLPETQNDLAERLYFHVSKQMSESMLKCIEDTNGVRAISSGGLEQLNIDVMRCESAMFQLGGTYKTESLITCFHQIRQLINLAVSNDWQRLIQERKSTDMSDDEKRYSRVSKRIASILVAKMHEGQKRKRDGNENAFGGGIQLLNITSNQSVTESVEHNPTSTTDLLSNAKSAFANLKHNINRVRDQRHEQLKKRSVQYKTAREERMRVLEDIYRQLTNLEY